MTGFTSDLADTIEALLPEVRALRAEHDAETDETHKAQLRAEAKALAQDFIAKNFARARGGNRIKDSV